MPTIKRCTCGALIKFVKTPAGHWQPQELDGSPHHAKCTDVGQYRKPICSGSGDNATRVQASAPYGLCPACRRYFPLQKRDRTRVVRHSAPDRQPEPQEELAT